MDCHCGLCKKDLTDPKTLPCLHSLCCQCLDTFVQEKGSLKCPTCGEKFTVEEGGVSKMEPNPFVEHILKVESSRRDLLNHKPSATQCGFCGEVAASLYCVQCHQFSCLHCQKIHNSTEATSHHPLISLELFLNMGSARSVPLCSKHPELETDTICCDCHLPICAKCIIPDHSHHDLALLKEIESKIKTSIEDPLNKVKQLSEQLIQSTKDTKRSLVSLDINARGARGIILKEFGNLRAELEKRQTEMLACLEATTVHKEGLILSQADTLEALLRTYQTSIGFAERLLKEGNLVEILECKALVVDQLNSLSEKAMELPPICNGNISFLLNFPEAALTKLIKNFGVIDSCCNQILPALCHLTPLVPLIPLKQGKLTAFLNNPFSAWIMTVGENGTQLPCGGANFYTNLEGPSQNVEIKIEDNNNGTYTISFTPNKCGCHTLTIKTGGVLIQDSPFGIEVIERLPARDPKSIHNAIQRFGAVGTAEGQFRDPQGICVNSQGEVIIADRGNHRVQVLARDGRFLRQFGASIEQFHHPEGIAVDSDDQIYVTDRQAHVVQIFDRQGHYLRQFGTGPGTGEGQFSSPSGIMIDNLNGNILVADFNNHRIQVFTRDGAFHHQFGSGALSNPLGICMNSRREILVSDYKAHWVRVFDESGLHLLRTIGRDQFAFPHYICVDGKDNLFVCAGGNNKVFVYDEMGSFLHSFTHSKLSHPNGIAFNPLDGALWITAKSDYAVFTF